MTHRALFSLLLCLAAAPALGETIQMDSNQQQALDITVAPLALTDAVSGSRLPAEVVIPPTQVRVVSAPQAGMVEQLRAEVGDRVSAGQLLARIQSPELVRLQRDFLQALTQQRLAKTGVERDRTLFREGIIAKRRYLETRSRYEELSAALDQGRQALFLVGMDPTDVAELERTRTLSTMLNVRATAAGAVLARRVEPGQRVEVADPLYRIAALDPLWLEIKAPLEEIGTLSAGDTVHVPGARAVGRVVAIGHEVDPASQTVLVRAEVTRGIGNLRPGQYVEAVLTTTRSDARYRVPASALVRNGPKTFVFVQTAQGFEPRAVNLFSTQDGGAVIGDHFTGEEKVAVTGVAAIKGAWLGLGGGE